MKMNTSTSWRNDRRKTSERGYGWRWQQNRALFLQRHPLCCMCEHKGIVTPATVVDHIIPHRGDEELFWNEGNWQPLCKEHHDRDKQTLETTGKVIHTIGPDGYPVEP